MEIKISNFRTHKAEYQSQYKIHWYTDIEALNNSSDFLLNQSSLFHITHKHIHNKVSISNMKWKYTSIYFFVKYIPVHVINKQKKTSFHFDTSYFWSRFILTFFCIFFEYIHFSSAVWLPYVLVSIQNTYKIFVQYSFFPIELLIIIRMIYVRFINRDHISRIISYFSP